MRGAVVTGAVAALVVIAAVAGAGWYLSRGKIQPGKVARADKVVVMLAGPGEDGATVAQLIAVVDVSGSALKVTDIDPTTRVSIPGTTYDRLRDAYPFGGGANVASALAAAQGGKPLPYLVVPAGTWSSEPSGTASLEVTLPRRLDVFDGTRLVAFPVGDAHVSPGDLPFLMQGIAYLDPSARVKVSTAVADSFVRGLGSMALPPSKVQTDLSADALASFLQSIETRSH
jgi:hypothetical protein